MKNYRKWAKEFENQNSYYKTLIIDWLKEKYFYKTWLNKENKALVQIEYFIDRYNHITYNYREKTQRVIIVINKKYIIIILQIKSHYKPLAKTYRNKYIQTYHDP